MNPEIIMFILLIWYATNGIQTTIWGLYQLYKTDAFAIYWWAHPILIVLSVLMGAVWPIIWIMELIENVRKHKVPSRN